MILYHWPQVWKGGQATDLINSLIWTKQYGRKLCSSVLNSLVKFDFSLLDLNLIHQLLNQSLLIRITLSESPLYPVTVSFFGMGIRSIHQLLSSTIDPPALHVLRLERPVVLETLCC